MSDTNGTNGTSKKYFIGFHVDKTLHDWIEKAAAAKMSSVSQVVREAILEFRNAHDYSPERKARQRR